MVGVDSDGDGIPDADDNCPDDPNADQADRDGDSDPDIATANTGSNDISVLVGNGRRPPPRLCAWAGRVSTVDRCQRGASDKPRRERLHSGWRGFWRLTTN